MLTGRAHATSTRADENDRAVSADAASDMNDRVAVGKGSTESEGRFGGGSTVQTIRERSLWQNVTILQCLKGRGRWEVSV